MGKYRIGVIVGSLRRGSYNRKIAGVLKEVAPQTFDMVDIEIGQLPLYNQDLDEQGPLPESWVFFREALQSVDAVLFLTPEYNRSVPGALKNALDVGSRPYGKNRWNGKPAAIVSVSPGALGAFGANHHLRQSLVFLNAPAMNQPEAYIGNVASMFDANGNFNNDNTRKFLKDFMESFALWVDANLRSK